MSEPDKQLARVLSGAARNRIPVHLTYLDGSDRAFARVEGSVVEVRDGRAVVVGARSRRPIEIEIAAVVVVRRPDGRRLWPALSQDGTLPRSRAPGRCEVAPPRVDAPTGNVVARKAGP